jgi:hypothetical protein
MEQRRELKSGEIDLIEYLAKKAEYPLNKFWHCYYKASPMILNSVLTSKFFSEFPTFLWRISEIMRKFAT